MKRKNGSAALPGLPLTRKICPYCGSQVFSVTAHVTQDWLVDGNGYFRECTSDCVDVIHQPNDEDMWSCADCGFEAVGKELNGVDFSAPWHRFILRIFDRDARLEDVEPMLSARPSQVSGFVERQWQAESFSDILSWFQRFTEIYSGRCYSVVDLANESTIIKGIWKPGDYLRLKAWYDSSIGRNEKHERGEKTERISESSTARAFERFPELVELLNLLKRAHYLLYYCRDHASDLLLSEEPRQTIPAIRNTILRDRMSGLANALRTGIFSDDTSLLESLQRDILESIRNQTVFCDGRQGRFGTLFDQILCEFQGEDNPFYRYYGKYWNEVELPPAVADLFSAYVDSRKSAFPGMIGVEHGGMDLPDGTVGICYYDLSDATILFENREAAERFSTEHSVEPADFLTLRNGTFISD